MKIKEILKKVLAGEELNALDKAELEQFDPGKDAAALAQAQAELTELKKKQEEAERRRLEAEQRREELHKAAEQQRQKKAEEEQNPPELFFCSAFSCARICPAISASRCCCFSVFCRSANSA